MLQLSPLYSGLETVYVYTLTEVVMGFMDRDYYREDFDSGSSGAQIRIGSGWTDVMKILIIINVIVFIIQALGGGLAPGSTFMNLFGLIPAHVTSGWVWQICTYMFLHANPGHLFWNMLIFYMFAGDVERALGAQRFFLLYLICGIIGAILTVLFPINRYGVTVGASGAILGALAAFGTLFPSRIILLFLILPIRAKNLVLLIAGLDMLYMLSGTGGNTACLAHLGGLGTGWMLIRHWRKKGNLAASRTIRPFSMIWNRIKSSVQNESSRKRDIMSDREYLDYLLDKINSSGINSLTIQEKKFLQDYSARQKGLD